MKPIRVRYTAPFGVRTGYAQAACDYMMSLKAVGAEVSVEPLHDGDSENVDGRYRSLLEDVQRDLEPTHVVVQTIPRFAHEFVTGNDRKPAAGVKKILVTTWETDKFPAEDVQNLNDNFDAVVVPAKFCASVLRRAGVKHTVVIPHAFDPQFWWNAPADVEPPAAPGPYVFYSILTWAARKGPIELLKAYFAEFWPKPHRTLLRIVTPYVNEDDVSMLGWCMGLEDLPPVEFLGTQRPLTEDEIKRIHYGSHCYVTLTRGEAWGLGAFEAAIVGNPVISTGFSAPREYLDHHPRARLVNYTLTPAVTPETKIGKPIEIGGIRVTPIAPNAPTGIAGDQNWAEPDIADARQCMRSMVEQRTGRTTSARRVFAKHYSHQTVGRLFLDLLGSL